jgi:RNA repair, ligase-Pnkp-associating, region of Hen1
VLVTISTTTDPATDVGFLLHKHPGKVQSFPVTAGTADVFYPAATPRRCTAALPEVTAMARRRRGLRLRRAVPARRKRRSRGRIPDATGNFFPNGSEPDQPVTATSPEIAAKCWEQLPGPC